MTGGRCGFWRFMCRGCRMPGKLDFPINKPIEVILQYAQGRAVPSKFGEGEIMFSLEGGQKMYLPEYVGRKIAALNVGAGGRVRITKSQRSDGKKGFEWDVEPVDEKAGSALLPQVKTKPASPVMAEHQAILRKPPVSTKTVREHSEKLAMALHNLRNFAKENNLAISPEDCTKITISVYIQQMQGGQVEGRAA